MNAPSVAVADNGQDAKLVRAIGLGSAILFVVGSVIGSGIFLTTGGMAAVSRQRRCCCWPGRWRGAGDHRRSDLCRDGRDVSAVRRRVRLSPRGVRTASGVSLRLGGAARCAQRGHCGRRRRVRRLPELFRSCDLASWRALERAYALRPVRAHREQAGGGWRRSSRSARSTTSAFAAAISSTWS